MSWGTAGLRTHIWNNNLRSIVLLAFFPVLLVGVGYALTILLTGFTDPAQLVPVNTGGSFSVGPIWAAEFARLPQIGVWSLIIAGIWFVIAWFFHQAMINAATGAGRLPARMSRNSITCWKTCASRAAFKCPNWPSSRVRR